MYEEQNRYLEAVKVLDENRQRLDKSSERWGELSFRIAEDYIASGDMQKAVVEYQQIVSGRGQAEDSWTLNAMIRLGEYHENNGDTNKALSLYRNIYSKAAALENKPIWLDAIKAKIEALSSQGSGN